MSSAPPSKEVLRRTDAWFLEHGLTYFVPEKRAEVRAALRARRVVPLLIVVVVVALASGIALAWVSDQFTAAPATLLSLVVLAVFAYLLTALRAAPIIMWALHRTFGSLFQLLPMTSRALPLLLLAITFLFINTEVWQVASNLTVGALWLVVVLFLLLGMGFLLVTLPEEVDRADDEVDAATLVRACLGTPLERASVELLDDPDADPGAYAEVKGFERWNLILALLVIQAVQVLLLTLSVFAFLVIFGTLIMTEPVMESWVGVSESGLTVNLVQVATFLAGFAGLYLTVSTVTDEKYRDKFFGDVQRELERAVGVRAVYLALRERAAP
jgi:hypothetical protein